jgi:hypothetical protein
LGKDSKDRPFEITLSADGKATSTQEKAKGGTWKEEGGVAVISWATGWTTKITKEGHHYVKMAYKKGVPIDGPPSNKSDAEEVSADSRPIGGRSELNSGAALVGPLSR